MDVKSAFLHRDLPEEMNMQQLPRFIQNGPIPLVCKLYALRQAPHTWYEKIHHFFHSCGFTRCKVEHYIYVHHQDSQILLVCYLWIISS